MSVTGTILDSCLKTFTMGTIKAFLLGVGAAYAVYYITKKRQDGTSIMDELLDNPSLFINKAKDYAIADVIQTVKEKI